MRVDKKSAEQIAAIKYKKYEEALAVPSVKELSTKASQILDILESPTYVWTEFEKHELENAYYTALSLLEKYEGYDD